MKNTVLPSDEQIKKHPQHAIRIAINYMNRIEKVTGIEIEPATECLTGILNDS